MKKIFSLLFALSFFWSGQLLAQTEENSDVQDQTISQAEIKDKGDKKKIKTEERGNSNVYSPETAKPTSPYAAKNNDIGGFTVTKFKESKTKKKLRRGEARSRMSVPDPKGKPLKHKKKRKFNLFG